MVLAVAEKWVKLAEDRMRQDLQALEELDIPEHLKLELREELEQMYGEMKRDMLQMASRKRKYLVVALSTGAALLVSGFLAGGMSPSCTCSWFQVRCWESAAAMLLYAVSLVVRDRPNSPSESQPRSWTVSVLTRGDVG